MLLVPLALAVPGVAPEAGEEVVLAAGSHEGAGPEGAGELVDDAGVVVEDEAVDQLEDDSEAFAEQSTGASPSATRRSAQKGASPTKKRAATASTATGKRNTVKTPSRSKPGPAAPPGAQAAKVAVAVAVAAQAPPSAPAPAPAPRPPAPPERSAPAAPTPAPGPAAGVINAVWDQLAVCESGNTNDTGAPYYGYWQFSAGTWRSMGEPGLPNDHSRDRQLAAAKRLQARSGWGQWPDCSRKLGLR